MPNDNLKFLGQRVREARKGCDLTQQELADQTGLSIKTVQDIEAGKKNTSYETLLALTERLGITLNTLSPSDSSVDEMKLQRLLGKFQSCSPENQEILFDTVDFLAEKLIATQYGSDPEAPE